jgi:hypothetical protein
MASENYTGEGGDMHRPDLDKLQSDQESLQTGRSFESLDEVRAMLEMEAAAAAIESTIDNPYKRN